MPLHRKMPTVSRASSTVTLPPPACGFVNYQDPMRALFGVEDEETVDM